MLNGYSNVRILSAKGSYGTVLLADRNSDNLEVAIKLNTTPSSENNARFLLENHILHQLSPHQNIVRPMSNIISDKYSGVSTDFYEMEGVEHNLEWWLHDLGSQDVNNKIDAFKQICHGLKHAHENGFSHRDLHWDNVLVNSSPSVNFKLTDFGRAYDFNNPLGVSSDPAWGFLVQPPEFAFGLVSDADQATYYKGDIFALGVLWRIIFESATDPLLDLQDFQMGIIRRLRMKTGVMNYYQQYITDFTDTERLQDYTDWLRIETTQLEAFCDIQLLDPNLSNKVTDLCKRMVGFDRDKRINTVDEILSELNRL